MRRTAWRSRCRRVGVCAATAIGVLTAVAASPATAAVSDDRCLRPDAAGDTTVDVRLAGTSHQVLAYVPKRIRRSSRPPLMLNLHGSSTNGLIQMQVSGMRAVAEAEGFVVAAPNGAIPVPPPPGDLHPGGSWAWNVPGVPPDPGTTARDDIRFLSRVVDAVSRTLCTDPSRTYATGFSGGGRMVSALGCERADELAAIAPVAGLRAGRADADEPSVPDVEHCRPERPLPALTFHGQQDPLNPYLGNGDLRWGYSVPVALQTWARLDGCRRGPQSQPITGNVTRLAYTGCRDDVTVELYRIADGSHTWPGATEPDGGQEIDAARIMWEFFERYRR